MYSTLNLYEFKMFLFDHVNLEEFMLLFFNFNMTLAATWMLDIYAKIQYFCTLVRGESLRQFDLFSADGENTETLNVDDYIKDLPFNFTPINSLSKQKCAVRRGTKNCAV